MCTAAVLMKNRQYMHEVCCTVGMDRQLDYHLATDRSGTRRRNNTQRSKGLKELKRWRRESQWVASNSCMPTCGEKRSVRAGQMYSQCHFCMQWLHIRSMEKWTNHFKILILHDLIKLIRHLPSIFIVQFFDEKKKKQKKKLCPPSLFILEVEG